ncbi:hypothetical protein H4Q26_009884 [Puccinia striiformis f. sp. tritici PST-130]|nr:hypothetical protein H4Q26_009884 [Puccinia striiformis f. sp. tritici PST-130]
MTAVPQVSWPEGVPRNPYLPLSLVNRTFRRCAQAMLFKNIALDNQWKASLLLRALTCPPPDQDQGIPCEDEHVDEDSQLEIKPLSKTHTSELNEVARHVRSLRFTWTGLGSMGKGGGSLICDIVRSCPLLENLANKPTFYSRCQEPILEALASARFIKDFVVFDQDQSNRPIFHWRANDVVARLFSKWDFLETIELTDLCGQPLELIEAIPDPLPVVNCVLQTIILTKPDLNEVELSGICKASRRSLRTLKIVYPSRKIDRTGWCRILRECIATDLESLELKVFENWHADLPPLSTEADHNDPARNSGLFDIVFKSSSALRKLKSLSITGPLIGSEFFTVLPQSLVKVALGQCYLPPRSYPRALPMASLVKALSLGPKDKKTEEHPMEPPSNQHDVAGDFDSSFQWLPNLRCLSLQDHVTSLDKETQNDIRAVKEPLKARGVCFHIFGSYILEEEDRMTEVVHREEEHLYTHEDLDVIDRPLPSPGLKILVDQSSIRLFTPARMDESHRLPPKIATYAVRQTFAYMIKVEVSLLLTSGDSERE